MQWPQITMIVLLAVNGGLALAQHGKPKGDYNFFVWAIDAAIMVWLLNAGGFFK